MHFKKTMKRLFSGGGIEDITRSTCVSGLSYKKSTKTLTVRFKKSGWVYEYYNVGEDAYNYLYKAYSIGKYFNWCIKDHYSYSRIFG